MQLRIPRYLHGLYSGDRIKIKRDSGKEQEMTVLIESIIGTEVSCRLMPDPLERDGFDDGESISVAMTDHEFVFPIEATEHISFLGKKVTGVQSFSPSTP